MIIVSSKIEVELFRHEFNNRRTRFEFIPVCVDLKESYETVDENFIFSGGRSNRDYKTLFQALDKIDMPVKIIAQQFNVSGLTIPQNVEFIDGSSEDEFSRMMCRSSFVVIPLERSNESSGHLVLLRAWSFGKAVIITENAGIQDYVKHGVNSIIIDHKDINGLHKAIKRLISDQDLRITLGKNGKEDVMNHFTEKAYSESLRALIFKFLIKSDRARLTSI